MMVVAVIFILLHDISESSLSLLAGSLVDISSNDAILIHQTNCFQAANEAHPAFQSFPPCTLQTSSVHPFHGGMVCTM